MKRLHASMATDFTLYASESAYDKIDIAICLRHDAYNQRHSACIAYAESSSSALGAGAFFLSGSRVDTLKVSRLMVRLDLQFEHLIVDCSLSPLTPRTLPKNTLFSELQLGQGPLATSGFCSQVIGEDK